MKPTVFRSLLIVGFVIMNSLAFAEDNKHTQTDSRYTNSTDNQSTNKNTDNHRASQWNLDQSEWAEYKRIMKGPRGLWTANLDPLHVLGINAKTPTERAKYARMMVQMELSRLDREWAFAEEYSRQGALLLAARATNNEKTEHKKIKPLKILKQRYFVQLPCLDKCMSDIQSIVSSTKKTDIYIVDASRNEITAWAKKMHIPPSMVVTGKISLNRITHSKSLAMGVERYPLFLTGPHQ